MKKRFKIAAVLLLAAFAMVFNACQSDDGDEGDSGDEPLQVRVITAIPTNVGLWDPIHFRVYDKIAEERGWDLQVAEAVEYGRADEVLNRWGNEGVDLVFSTDNGFEDSFLAAAEQHPDTKWAMMSQLSTTNDLENVVSYSINWCELGFAIGASAGAVSETGTVGMVGAVPIGPHVLMLEAQKMAADLANPGTKVIEQNSNDFVDPVLAQETAYSVLEKGADVIFTSHGGPVEQIARAAAERDSYFIGYLDDSTDLAPDAVVTSVPFDFTYGYESVADMVESGEFETGIFHSGLAEGSIEVLPFRLGFEDRQADVEALLEQLEAREITFPEGECESFN